jgi:hypothetical protein
MLTDSIVRQLASQLDLNTLHDLARTCRQFRANLLEYRDQLIRHTLHCDNEDDAAGARLDARLQEARGSSRSAPQLTSGRVVMGKCARDMVAECQRCATVVCRVCCLCDWYWRMMADGPELHHQAATHARTARPSSPSVPRMLKGSAAAVNGLQEAPSYLQRHANPVRDATCRVLRPCSSTIHGLCLSANTVHMRHHRVAVPAMRAAIEERGHAVRPFLELAYTVQPLSWGCRYRRRRGQRRRRMRSWP